MNLKKTSSNRRIKLKQLDSSSKNYKKILSGLFIDGMGIAKIKPDAIAKILDEHLIPSVFIGGSVVGCHTGQPRSTKDVDLIIPPESKWKTAVSKIVKLGKGLKVRQYPSFIEIYEKTPLGDSEVVDIINVPSGSYGLVFKNLIELDVNGKKINIPTAEMMIVLKYTAAINPIRPKNKQMQDWIDIYNIVSGNKTLSLWEIKHLANSVVPGFGDDLQDKIKSHLR